MKIEKQKRSTFHFCHLYLDLEIGPGVSREKHPGLKLYPDLEKAKRDRGLTYQITHIYLLHCIAIKGQLLKPKLASFSFELSSSPIKQ